MRRPHAIQTLASRTAAIGFALGAVALGLVPTRALAAAPELSASLSSGELTFGAALTISGRASEEGRGLGGLALALQADAYPFRGFKTVARLASNADGSYTFAGVVKPDRNTHLRVVSEGSPAASSAPLAVAVEPAVAINAASLGVGRTRLSIRIAHTLQGGSGSISARWFVAARGTRVFRLAAVTTTRELSSGLTYASATIDPPAKRFAYRVCLNPPWEAAMGAPSSHGRCPERDYTVAHDVG
jgi:hypothetical protein